MMIASAIVAIEKTMPRIRSVNKPTPKPSVMPTTAAAPIWTTSGAPVALNKATAV